MIHVQIASDITTTGVEGVRWVLLEPSEAPAPVVATPAPAPAGPMHQPMVAPLLPARPSLRIEVWQLAIIGLGMIGALVLSQQRLGLAPLRGGGPAAAPVPAALAAQRPTPAPPTLAAAAAAATVPAPPPADSVQPYTPPAPNQAGLPAALPLADSRVPAAPVPAASAARPDAKITAGL